MYCNYSKDKFGNELTFILPCWCSSLELLDWDFYNVTNEMIFQDSLMREERNYKALLNKGWTPQQARAVLPNALKTELVMTGFISDWKHFFELRCDKAAHPQARELAIPLQEEFINRQYI